jgi:hypothetical protein
MMNYICRYCGGRPTRPHRQWEETDRNKNTHNNQQALQNPLVVPICVLVQYINRQSVQNPYVYCVHHNYQAVQNPLEVP